MMTMLANDDKLSFIFSLIPSSFSQFSLIVARLLPNGKRCDVSAHNYGVNNVPAISKIWSFMKYGTDINDLVKK